MKTEARYELPIFSSGLKEDPIIETKNLNVKLVLDGYDDEDQEKKVIIQFENVLCYKYTSTSFTQTLYGAYDKIVELMESEWLNELKQVNKDKFNYWGLKHYVLYLDGIGLYQFIAQRYETTVVLIEQQM